MSRSWTEAKLSEIVKRSNARLIDRDPKAEPHRVRNALPVARGKKARKPKKAIDMSELSEHAEQCLIFQWWNLWASSKGLDPRLLVAVPNAQKFMSKARNIYAAYASAKAEGLRDGYPDLILDLATDVFHGMRIELKAKDGKISPEQREYADLLRRQDYNVITAFGADEAIRALTVYCESALAGEPRGKPGERIPPRLG